jgi:hypothetical protein
LDLQDILLNLAESHSDIYVFKGAEFEKIIFIDAENKVENPNDLVRQINVLMQQMSKIFVIKKDP